MQYLHTDRTPDGRLRLVFDDCVVSRQLGAHPTLADVAAVLRDLGPRRYGDPVAIDVTVADAVRRLPPSFALPPGMRFEDDPAAHLEDRASWHDLLPSRIAATH